MNNIDYSELFSFLLAFANKKDSLSETLGSLSISGKVYANLQTDINNLFDYFSKNNFGGLLKFKLDGNSVNEEDLSDYIAGASSWEISVNKSGYIKVNPDQSIIIFFLFQNNLCSWIKNLNPFDKENPFNKYKKIKVFVSDINLPLYSNTVEFLPVNYACSTTTLNKFNLPSVDQINQNVHLLSDRDVIINPANFILIDGDIESEIAKEMRKHAITILSSSLISSFYNESKVTIDGYRTLILRLSDSSETYTHDQLVLLCEVIDWVYKEKTATRKKLILERLSIDLTENESLIHGLKNHLKNAYTQAVSRYNFIILERKDLYLKELKDLLKDIKGQSDLYSQKIRTLLSNLLRDSLAALLLVGFTVFTKFSDNIQLDKNKLLDYVFSGLAIYYIISILYQIMIDVIDINVSKKELLYWKNTTRELLPEGEFNMHINESLKGRKTSLYLVYPLIILSYLLVSFACYKFPSYFKDLESQNKPKENIAPPLTKNDSVKKVK
jgi:hypothetical protein